MQAKIVDAQKRLPSVTVSKDIKLKVATVCSNLDIDGLRGDLVVNRAAQALVAFEGRTSVLPIPSFLTSNIHWFNSSFSYLELHDVAQISATFGKQLEMNIPLR